jgi:hypothetical protein
MIYVIFFNFARIETLSSELLHKLVIYIVMSCIERNMNGSSSGENGRDINVDHAFF